MRKPREIAPWASNDCDCRYECRKSKLFGNKLCVTEGGFSNTSNFIHRLSPKVQNCIEREVEGAMKADVVKQNTPTNSRPSCEELGNLLKSL